MEKKHINILMLAIIYKSVAIPIFWTGLSNGKGNSSTQDRIDLIKKFRQVFPEIKMTNVVADAEFIVQDWFNWLNTEKNSILHSHSFQCPSETLWAK
ncbi:hypothetical protein ACLSYN_10310 [Avibacterium avium]|uniref:hypothetical protein n=1 Tax=Avibacterium avium TaxID=751 RepID=UPI003BF7F639